MIILMLDFDGVIFTLGGAIHSRMESGEEKAPRWELDPVSLSLIKRLLKDHNEIRIVVSSVWRIGTSLEELKEILGAEIGSKVIGKTPTTRKGHRGTEIKMWLESNKHLNVTDLIILDDDSDMDPFMGYLFRTNSYNGFSASDWSDLQWYLTRSESEKRLIRVKKVLKIYLRHTYTRWRYKIDLLSWKIQRWFK